MSTTTAATSPEPASTPIELEFHLDVRLEARVDLVAFYQGFTPKHQDDYWRWRPGYGSGYGDEHHRPIVYLEDWLNEHSEYGTVSTSNRAVTDYSDTSDWWEYRIGSRRGTFATTTSYGGKWTEADFTALAALVPWIQPLDPAEAAEEHARLAEAERAAPGPYDIPLPL